MISNASTVTFGRTPAILLNKLLSLLDLYGTLAEKLCQTIKRESLPQKGDDNWEKTRNLLRASPDGGGCLCCFWLIFAPSGRVLFVFWSHVGLSEPVCSILLDSRPEDAQVAGSGSKRHRLPGDNQVGFESPAHHSPHTHTHLAPTPWPSNANLYDKKSDNLIHF